MGSGFSKMKKQRRQMEEQFAKLQEEMQTVEHVGTSGNGLVEIKINGEKTIKSLKIKPECVDRDDVEGLEDLIIAAFKDAEKKLESASPMSGMNPMNFF